MKFNRHPAFLPALVLSLLGLSFARPLAAQVPAGPNVSAPADPLRQPGVVWVNSATGIYHDRFSRWFGTTRDGKYLRESEAVREGDRAARNERRPESYPQP